MDAAAVILIIAFIRPVRSIKPAIKAGHQREIDDQNWIQRAGTPFSPSATVPPGFRRRGFSPAPKIQEPNESRGSDQIDKSDSSLRFR